MNKECNELTPDANDNCKFNLIIISNDSKYIAFSGTNHKIYVYDIERKCYKYLLGNK